jgi:hypothetical protein
MHSQNLFGIFCTYCLILSQFERTIVQDTEKDEKRKGKNNERKEKRGKCGEIIERK